jgi:hypothetical protein
MFSFNKGRKLSISGTTINSFRLTLHHGIFYLMLLSQYRIMHSFNCTEKLELFTLQPVRAKHIFV